MRSPFVDYKLLELPNLSAQRHSPSTRGRTSVPIHQECTEAVLLAATARCLGAYCSSNDILLGWQPRRSDRTKITATRICWADSSTWTGVLSNITLQEKDNTPESINKELGPDSDYGGKLSLAVLSEDLYYDHPLVLSLDTFSSDSSEDRQTLHLSFASRLFHQSAGEILAHQLRDIVKFIIANPDADPSTLSFLSPSLKSSVAIQHDKPTYDHQPECRTVVEYLRDHDPSLVALEFYPDLYEENDELIVQRLTYGELQTQSNRFAAYLCHQGLQPEDRVAVCMQRSLEFHICLLGILKAGGCYVPIEPELPEERRDFIVRDSGSRFVLTSQNVQEHINKSLAHPEEQLNKAGCNSLAYLLYTSGTTGTPKGCLLTHDGFAQAILALSWFANQAGPNKHSRPQRDRYLAVASIAFDVHLSEMFVALSLGMTLISAPRSQLLESLPLWLQRLQITHVGIVPSLIEATMLAVERSDEKPGNGDVDTSMKLAYIASGGEKMSDAILDRWADHTSVSLANFYGPTEVTIGCSARFMTSKTRKENIGCVFRNCFAHVVDDQFNVVSRGCAGELLVGGRLVGRGYHQRQDLTEKAFIDWNGEKAYRTGDLVRLMPDDTFEILGRIDTQIKLRGVRIEAEGISSVIRDAAAASPSLTTKGKPDVSTVLTQHPDLRTDQLVAFVACDSNVPITKRRSEKPSFLTRMPDGLMKALEDACSRELASYMRPAHIVPVDFLPLNSNGKTDSKALVALFQGESLNNLGKARMQKQAVNGTHDKPMRDLNDVEYRIAEVVAKFTAVPMVQLTPLSDFFELGLDSTKLVRLGSELRRIYPEAKTGLTVSNLIRNSNIEKIASFVLSDSGEPTKTASGIESRVSTFSRKWKSKVERAYGEGKVESVMPTFPVQEGVLYRSADLESLYVQHVVMRLTEDTQVEKMKSAWKELMGIHEILRTVFFFSNEIVQVVLKPVACELQWQTRSLVGEMTSFPSQFLESQAEELSRDINQNISTKPAFRLVLHRQQHDETAKYLTLSIHHSVYDGVSLPLLLKDLESLYVGQDRPTSSPLDKVLDAVYGVDDEKAKSYWVNVFNGFDWSRIPNRLASGQTASTYPFEFSDSNLYDWEDRARKTKTSLQAILTAAFGVVIGNHMYGCDEVVFGTIRSGRSFLDDDLNNARAPLLSVLPTRVNLTEGRDMLRSVQKSIGEVLAFEHVPLGKMQQWVQHRRNLFEVLFSVSVYEDDEGKLWKLELSSQPHADYILAVEVVLDRSKGKVRVDCAYTDPLTRDFVELILPEIEVTAVSIAEGSDITISQNGSNHSDSTGSDTNDNLANEEDALVINEELEATLCSIVSQFLDIERQNVTSTTSLISLGLDSVKSIGLSRLFKQEGLRISALEIMRRPIIRRLAARSDDTESPSRVEDEMNRLFRQSIEGIETHVDKLRLALDEEDNVYLYPVTALQAGMLSQTISSDGSLYIHAFPFRLMKVVDLGRLKQAWARTVEYLSLLRASFHFIPALGSWIQAVHTNAYPNWTETAKHMHSSISADIEAFIKALDFSSEASFARPPVYARLYHDWSSSSSSVLVLVMHHALYDGLSVDKLNGILKAFYHQVQPDPAPQFSELLGYFKYQERYGTSFWTNYLEDYPRPRIYSRSDAKNVTYSVTCEIPVTKERLSDACRYFEVTAQCLGQAALAKLLAKLYGVRDVVFGHVVSGRNVARGEDVFGPLISTVPCRVKLSQAKSNLELVRSIQFNNTAGQKWQHASLRSIQKALGLNSLWDCLYVFQPAQNDSTGGADLWQFDDSEEEAAKIQYPLNIELHQKADKIVIKVACQSAFLLEKDLKNLLQGFSSDFTTILQSPEEACLPEGLSDEDANRRQADRTHPSEEGHSDVNYNVSDTALRNIIAIVAAATDVAASSIHAHSMLSSLGVDSISAIHVSAKARQAGYYIRSSDILSCQRISDLLNVSRARGINKRPTMTLVNGSSKRLDDELSQLPGLDIAAEDLADIMPASAGMEWLVGMWYLSDRSRFQHVFAFALPEDIAEDRLQSAWDNLVVSSPILRSTFYPAANGDLRILTFEKLPGARCWSTKQLQDSKPFDEGLQSFTKELVSSPLSADLPPIRPYYVRHQNERFFVLHIHHFQYDAWSLRLLINGLCNLYIGKSACTESNLRQFLTSANSSLHREEQARYWQSYLTTSFEPSLLPKSAGATEKKRERHIYILDNIITDVRSMRQKARHLSLSLNAIFLACWARVQADHCKDSSATFGLWHQGRSGDNDDFLNLAVTCMNVLPVHVNVGSSSLEDLSHQVQLTLRERSATVQQSHLKDVNQWCGRRDDQILLNVYVNILESGYLGDESANEALLRPLDLPYYIPSAQDPKEQALERKPSICNILEDAAVIEFVIVGHSVTASIEYNNSYLDEGNCRDMLNTWTRLVSTTLR